MLDATKIDTLLYFNFDLKYVLIQCETPYQKLGVDFLLPPATEYYLLMTYELLPWTSMYFP